MTTRRYQRKRPPRWRVWLDQNLTKRVHNWTVLGIGSKKVGTNVYARVRCACGVEKEVQINSMIANMSHECQRCAQQHRRLNERQSLVTDIARVEDAMSMLESIERRYTKTESKP